MDDDYESFEEWIDAEVHPLLTGLAMGAPVNALELEGLVQAWALLAFVSQAVEARQKILRERLLDEAEEFGRMTEKGGQRLMVHNSLVQREKRIAKLPDEEGFKALLASADIDFDAAFSKVQKVILDPSKIDGLVNLGKLKAGDVERLKKVTWALRVKPSNELDTILEEAFGQDPDDEPLDESRTPRKKRTAATGPRKS